MAVLIRSASQADGEAILALMPRLAAFDVPAERNPDHLWLGDAELVRRWLAGEADQCLLNVAVDADGSIVGLALVTMRPELLSREPSAHLEAIAVADGQEGRGVGSRLLASAESSAQERGAQSMSLTVFAANERARLFYASHGYDGELLRYIKRFSPG